MSQVFGEDGLEHLGFASMKGLKQFMCTSTDTIHYVIVSTESFRRDSLFDCLVYLNCMYTAKAVSSHHVPTSFLSLH